jgi:hypothetical protein
MKPPLPHSESAVPRTLHAQLEIAKAIRMLMAPDDDERLYQRRAELAAIHSELEAIKRDLQKAGEECLALAKAELRAVLAKKYNPDQPRVPAGNSDGGQWTRDGNTGTGPGRHVRYAANGTFPPVPPGYDPNSWKQGKWPNDGPYWLEDPDGRKYTVHPEDDRHWRHWDIQDSDGDDQGRWPPNSKKPWSTQKRKPNFDQSLSDPNGDAPPWSPDPFVPVVPQPILPTVPIPSIPIEPVPFPIPPVLVPG